MEKRMIELGWKKEIVSIPSLGICETRYFKEGSEISETEALELMEANKNV